MNCSLNAGVETQQLITGQAGLVLAGAEALEAIDGISERLLARAKAPISAVRTGHLPLDIDVFMDTSATHKEGVSRTYAGVDGYAPIDAYLGNEGWCVGLELRERRA